MTPNAHRPDAQERIPTFSNVLTWPVVLGYRFRRISPGTDPFRNTWSNRLSFLRICRKGLAGKLPRTGSRCRFGEAKSSVFWVQTGLGKLRRSVCFVDSPNRHGGRVQLQDSIFGRIDFESGQSSDTYPRNSASMG